MESMNESTDWGTATWRYWQKILNAEKARGRPQRTPVSVCARIVWERDGEEWISGQAIRLDPDDGTIFVELRDRRCRGWGVWLRPNDVWWEGKSRRGGATGRTNSL